MMPDFKLDSTVYSTSFKNRTYFDEVIDECKTVLYHFFKDQSRKFDSSADVYRSERFGEYKFLIKGKEAGAGGAVVSENHGFIPLAYINKDGSITGFRTDDTTYVLSFGAAAQGKKNGEWQRGEKTQRRMSAPGVLHKMNDEGTRESFAGVSLMPIKQYNAYLSEGTGYSVNPLYMNQKADEFAESIFLDWLNYYKDEAATYYTKQTGMHISPSYYTKQTGMHISPSYHTDYDGTIGKPEPVAKGKPEPYETDYDGTIGKPEPVARGKPSPLMEAVMRGAKAGNRHIQNTLERGNNPDSVPMSMSLKGIRERIDEELRPYYIYKMESNVWYYQNMVDRFAHKIIIEHRR